MKAIFHASLRKYIWNMLKSLTNDFSNLSVKNLGNGDVKCCWDISSLDSLKIKFSKTYFYAIRFFDVTNNRNKDNATCIMKEIQVSKFQSAISFPIPINKGVYYFEFGYRKLDGEWRVIAHQYLNFGYRIRKIINIFDNDNWFNDKNLSQSNNFSEHEEAYQLSLDRLIGGSEKFL